MSQQPEINPLDKLPSLLKKDLDKSLCTCMDVIKIDVINAITEGASTLDAVKAKTYACTGAGCCEQQIQRLIKCLTAPESRRQRKKREKLKR